MVGVVVAASGTTHINKLFLHSLFRNQKEALLSKQDLFLNLSLVISTSHLDLRVLKVHHI